jgi:seryl-tRNA synthetase
MLDPKIIRDEPEKIRKMLKNRVVDFDFDSLIELDKKRRDLIIKTDELRKTRNQVSLEFGKKKKVGENTTELVNKMTNVSQDLENLETTQKKIDVDYAKLASTIPNFIHESVPIGEDDLTFRTM